MVRTKERMDFLSDVLVTAVEGGVNYWADVKGYTKDNVTVFVYDNMDHYTFTPATISLGIDIIKSNKDFKVNDTILGDILVGDHRMDESYIDSSAADVIVQAAMFGEIIYG